MTVADLACSSAWAGFRVRNVMPRTTIESALTCTFRHVEAEAETMQKPVPMIFTVSVLPSELMII